MASVTFEFNVAFTLPVNSADVTTKLSAQELWQGIKRGGRNPNDFAEYVASCEVVSGGRKEFRRKLILADGAVHTAKGEALVQDVWIAENLHVMSATVDTGARTTWIASKDASDTSEGLDLYLTAMYELKLSNVEKGTEKSGEIERNYTELARGACRDAVVSIRKWKEAGLLQKWKEEDDVLDAQA